MKEFLKGFAEGYNKECEAQAKKYNMSKTSYHVLNAGCLISIAYVVGRCLRNPFARRSPK